MRRTGWFAALTRRGLQHRHDLSGPRAANDVGPAACLAEPLEERLLMALSKAAGGSGYSGTLSTNPAIRQQQLICDPDEPLAGSTSVQYDAKLVSLIGAAPGPGYEFKYDGFVGIIGEKSNGPELQPLAEFLERPAGEETGFVQFRFQIAPGAQAGQIQPPRDFEIVDEAGVEGVDTHALWFQELDGSPDDAQYKYRIFAAAKEDFPEYPLESDFLIVNDREQTRLEPKDLSPAEVSTKPQGATPPKVSKVFVSGTTWSDEFRKHLQATNQGDAAYGFAVPAGAAQLDELPWGGIDTISIRFDQQVLVLDLDLVIRGARASTYAISDFDYDERTYTATWTLPQPLHNDRILLDLNGGADGVVNELAISLDGDWAGTADEFPSGDGAAGGDFRFGMNVLSGDANRDGRVTAIDWFELRRKIHSSTAEPGFDAAAYTIFHDLNGDGSIGTPDLLITRRNLLRALPPAEASAASVAGMTRRGIPITRGMFGGEPIL